MAASIYTIKKQKPPAHNAIYKGMEKSSAAEQEEKVCRCTMLARD
jgi:hypothetical protein